MLSERALPRILTHDADALLSEALSERRVTDSFGA